MITLDLSIIRRDGGTQPRAAIDFNVVEEYANAVTDGAVLPPIVVYFDGAEYWLADGFHRWHAHEVLGLAEVECDVRQGTLRDAILFSCSANAAHGMRRTNADKRRAVLRLLDDPEWVGWSDSKIAKVCAVDPKTVSAHRPAPSMEIPKMERPRLVERGGTVYQQNTARIGSPPRGLSDLSPAEVQEARQYRDAERAEPGITRRALDGMLDRGEEPTREALREAVASAPRASSEREQQIARDNANAPLASAIWEIQRQMGALPKAREFVERFPHGVRHTLSSDTLRALSDWFSGAADAWSDLIEGASHVAAE